MGKSICLQALQPEFEAPNPHDSKEPVPTSCPLISTYINNLTGRGGPGGSKKVAQGLQALAAHKGNLGSVPAHT